MWSLSTRKLGRDESKWPWSMLALTLSKSFRVGTQRTRVNRWFWGLKEPVFKKNIEL